MVPEEVHVLPPSESVILIAPVTVGVPVTVITGAVKLYDNPAGYVMELTLVAPVSDSLISTIAIPAQTV